MTHATKKQFPIGIQTFAKLREDNQYYYVDKTKLILDLIQESDFIFLSRPRRFGKSLTLDTVAELFSTNKKLFTGLYAENHWDWETKYPVFRFTFAKGIDKSTDELTESIIAQLNENAQKLGIEFSNQYQFIGNLFNELINQTVAKYQTKVVILIDEYDKPILDNLENDDIALQMRDGLRDFYSVIKAQDANIRFAMLTGVSKFSKINLFSGLNNLLDVTLDEKFSAICGYTQNELEDVFAPELGGVDLNGLKHWYNGYNWGGESVYNPFDILLFLNSSKKAFKPYWIETGNATFLIDKIVNEKINLAQIQQEIADVLVLSSFEVGDISPIALMFQTGYLTIDKVVYKAGMELYHLKFPNMEVQQSFSRLMLTRYLNRKINAIPTQSNLYDALIEHDLTKVQQIIKAFFASIPHDWHRNNKIGYYEGYWASVFYALFASLGFTTIAEDVSRTGNIDMTLIVDGENKQKYVYIFEFKVIDDTKTGKALAQIYDKEYAKKYQLDNHIIHKIGIEFHSQGHDVIFDMGEWFVIGRLG